MFDIVNIDSGDTFSNEGTRDDAINAILAFHHQSWIDDEKMGHVDAPDLIQVAGDIVKVNGTDTYRLVAIS